MISNNQNSIILTPVEKHKSQKILCAADNYSYLVSKVRQPVNLSLTG